MPAYGERSWGQRAAALGVVAALHAALLVLLITQSGQMRALLPRVTVAQILPAPESKPPPPPPIKPVLVPPPLMPIPIPEVNVPPPPAQSRAPRAVVRTPAGPPASHFGSAAGDAGLGLDVATTSGGGARGRGSLADFQAAVKRAVLARKVQPTLAWDRRNTCVVNYRVWVRPDGSMGGYSIDPCAIPEINRAAEQAIREAAPFPVPPDLGAPRYQVEGTLIFHP